MQASWHQRVGEWAARAATSERRRIYPRMVLAALLALWILHGAGALAAGGLARANAADDFLAFYTGGRLWLDGQQAQLYDAQAQAALQARAAAVPEGFWSAFVSPPFAVLLFAPFSLGAPLLGLVLWWLAGLLALWMSLQLLHKTLPGLPPPSKLWGMALLFHPTGLWWMTGQASPFWLLALSGHMALLRRGQELWAGVVLGLLLVKPQLGIGPALYLLGARRWRAIAGGMLGASAWLALGLLLFPNELGEFVRRAPALLSFIRAEEYHTWGLVSGYGFATQLVDGLSRPLGSAAAWGVTAWLGWRVLQLGAGPWLPRSRPWELRFAAASALGLVLSPHLFVYDLLLLLLPLAMARAQAVSARLDGWTVLLWASSALGFYLAMGMNALSAAAGLPRVALQVATLGVVGWGLATAREADEAGGS